MIKICMAADGEICIEPNGITRHQAILLIEAILIEVGDEFLQHVESRRVEERPAVD